MSEGLLRQRRNLMVVSIALFFIFVGGISIDHEITILGAKLRIANPLVLYVTLWIMYIYFFLRYIQYYFDIDKDEKDYWFEWYPASFSFNRHELFSWWNFFIDLLEYIFNNFMVIAIFIFNIVVNKNFSDNFFPIVFAILIGWTSYNSSFTNEHKDEALLFMEKTILEPTVYKPIKQLKEQINL